MLPLAILAGGLATRLQPITQTIPKALVDVAGQPFICRQLEYLHSQGLRKVVLCIGYLGEMIQSVVGDGSQFGIEISYSPDGPELLGTGGALTQAVPLLGEHFFVLYGDSFLPINFAEVEDSFFASNRPALMTVLENNDRWDKSNVVFQDGELLEYNKITARPEMHFIDYGLGVLSRSTLENFPAAKAFDLAEVYQALSAQGQLAGYQVTQRFYEIGSHQGLKETIDYFMENEKKMSYAQSHLDEASEIIKQIDVPAIEAMADLLATVKSGGGRLFFLGVGGSAGNCSHAVNDFRKIVGIESYAPTDNVSELTARTNDEGWSTIFAEWLKTSKLCAKDALFILSVGGGNLEKNISPNLVEALKYGKSAGAKVTGIVGRDGGFTAQSADVCVIVPTVNPENITPHSEAFQAVIWHLLVSHPKLKANETKWESAVK
jgi:dTDP-glucose pyrophosphorylase